MFFLSETFLCILMILPSTFMIINFQVNSYKSNYDLFGHILYLMQFIFINVSIILTNIFNVNKLDKVMRDKISFISKISLCLPSLYMSICIIFNVFKIDNILKFAAFTLYVIICFIYLLFINGYIILYSFDKTTTKTTNSITSFSNKKKKKNNNPYKHQYGRYQYHNDFCGLLFPNKYYSDSKKNVITNKNLYNKIKSLFENDELESRRLAWRPFYLYETSGRIITICFSKIFVLNDEWYVGFGATIWNPNNNLKNLLKEDLKKIRARLDTPDSDVTDIVNNTDVGNTKVDVNTKWSKKDHYMTAFNRFKENPVILRIDKELLLNAMRTNGISRNINGPDNKGRILIRSDVIGSYIRKFGVIFGCYARS